MIRSTDLPSFDRDQPLELLADDRERAGLATEACHALAPLLAVAPAELAADDRASLVTHLARCARCRAVGFDLWLDGEVPPPETVAIARLPAVRSLTPTARRWPWIAAAAAAACVGLGVGVASWSGSTRSRRAAPVAVAPGGGAQAAPDDRPWARGVPESEQRAALDRFNAGNALFAAGKRTEAAVEYRAGLTHWDHPALSFNLALCLAGLDEPIELQRALLAALRYGPAPIDAEKYQRAQAMLLEVNKVLARIDFTTRHTGAVLTIDGQDVFTGPGRFDGVVRAGRHTWTVRLGTRSLPARTLELHGGDTEALPDLDRELVR